MPPSSGKMPQKIKLSLAYHFLNVDMPILAYNRSLVRIDKHHSLEMRVFIAKYSDIILLIANISVNFV